MAKQPKRTKVLCDISVFLTLGTEVHEQLFRSRGQSDDLDRFHPNFEEEHPRGNQGPLSSSSTNLTRGHAAKWTTMPQRHYT
ncbi:hypothetical protein TNCV_965071 [Trichonephila clavipes]|nr:hypothetical protein TNCV_965071 [Trichonephila clavipes]